MGGGDLNLKKSWHPSTYHNLKKVWEAEQQAAQEEQKLEQLRKEKAAERAAEELRRLQETAGLVTRKPERVEWLYTGGGSGGAPAAAATAEDYLLGRRRFEPSLEKASGDPTDGGVGDTGSRGPLSTSSSVNTSAEYEARLREDPLLAIKQKELELKRSLSARPAGSRADATSDRECQGRRALHKPPAARPRSKSPSHARHRDSDGRRAGPSRDDRDSRSYSRDFRTRRHD